MSPSQRQLPLASSASRRPIRRSTSKLIDTSVTHTSGNYELAMHTLYEGAILAVIVVFLFLRDWRATIIAALTLPLSIFPAFWVMELLGFSLNVVTLLAITLSTGILVDDAIVEIENIVRHIRMGKSPYQLSRTSCMAPAGSPAAAAPSVSRAAIAVLVAKASDPPFRSTALPDFKHRPAASAVTLGRDS